MVQEVPVHEQTCANFHFYQHMNERTWTWEKKRNETKWNGKGKSISKYGQKKFYGKWKIEALLVDEAYHTRVVVVNDISCTDRSFFSLFFSFLLLSTCCMPCYAQLCDVCSNFTGCVVFNYVRKSIFQWAYRTHTHIHSLSAAATVHSGKGVRSLGKINVCFTWIKLNKLKRRQHLYVP